MRMAVSLMDGTALMVIGVSSVVPRQSLNAVNSSSTALPSLFNSEAQVIVIL